MRPAPQAFAWLIAATIVSSDPTQAQSTERLPVTDIRPLLELAIDRGSARGVLIGAAANYIRSKFDVSAPIEVEVRAIEALSDPACSRLEVATRQAGVLEKGERHDKTLRYQLNYCRGGRIPERH